MTSDLERIDLEGLVRRTRETMTYQCIDTFVRN